MEFPILNYLIYLVSLIFGYNHWYGRLINMIVSTIGIYFFYKIIKRYFTSDHAFYASMILILSLWFSYSRKIMPDTFSTSLVIISIYYDLNFLYQKNIFLNLLLYFFFGLLGVLAKLPAVFLFIIFTPIIFDKNILFKQKIYFSFISVLLLIPVICWYFYWVPFLVDKYKFYHFFMGKAFRRAYKNSIVIFLCFLNGFMILQ